MTVLPLAETLALEGDYEKAEKYYREELAIKEKNLGNGHSQVAYTLANLAELYKNTGQPQKAVRVFQVRSIQVSRTTLKTLST